MKILNASFINFRFLFTFMFLCRQFKKKMSARADSYIV